MNAHKQRNVRNNNRNGNDGQKGVILLDIIKQSTTEGHGMVQVKLLKENGKVPKR